MTEKRSEAEIKEEATARIQTDASGKSFWEKWAKIYTAFMAKNEKSYRQISRYLRPCLFGDSKVLELACGTGQLTFLCAAQAAQWEATDYSEKMVAEAARRNRTVKGMKNIHFMVQDATCLTYEAESFDAVVIANALHIMPDPEMALQEIRRVLKPGGLLFAPTFVYEEGYSGLMIRLMEKAGFHTYHKWKMAEYEAFVIGQGYRIEKAVLEAGRPLPECILIGRKMTENFERQQKCSKSTL